MKNKKHLRGVFAALVIVALASVGIAGATHGFTDVTGGKYYSEAVDWAYDSGVTKGTSSTTFEPESFCS